MASSPGRLAGAMTVAALMLGAIASPASARVTFSGIDGVNLGMSEADVTGALGTPSKSRPGRQASTKTLVYRRRKLEVVVHSGRDRVVSIITRSRAERTSAGLGIGTSTGFLRSRLRDEKCSTARDTMICSVQRGDRVMDFEIRRGRVSRVAVSDLG